MGELQSSPETVGSSRRFTGRGHTTFNPERTKTIKMKLGAFCLSLAVKDLAVSRAFYEKLGFEPTGGDAKNWLVLRNENSTIGLFQGMFERNMLTFNPGWTNRAEPLAEFEDVRAIQRQLKASGLTLDLEADQMTTGPAHLMLTDPDGNPVLIDQHVG